MPQYYVSSSLNRVLPSVLVKLSGQFPACATIEPEIDCGRWSKFLNNDGLEAPVDGNQSDMFQMKALAFAHWSFHRFNGRLLVCDLQG